NLSRRKNDQSSKTRQGREVGFNLREQLPAAILEVKPHLLLRFFMLQAHAIGAVCRAHIAPAQVPEDVLWPLMPFVAYQRYQAEMRMTLLPQRIRQGVGLFARCWLFGRLFRFALNPLERIPLWEDVRIVRLHYSPRAPREPKREVCLAEDLLPLPADPQPVIEPVRRARRQGLQQIVAAALTFLGFDLREALHRRAVAGLRPFRQPLK